MTDELTIKVKASSWARVTRERDEARAECLEQSRLLAMSADREAKLLGELESAKKSLDHSRWVHGMCNPPTKEALRMKKEDWADSLRSQGPEFMEFK